MRLHIALALTALTAWLAAAGTGVAGDPAQTHVEVSRNGVAIQHESGPAVRVRDMLSLKVYNANNESLGKIEDFVMDPGTAQVRYAVLSFGGFLGMGDKYFAVPWHDLQMVQKGTTRAGTIKEDHFVLNVDKNALKNAPGFDKNHWPDFANSNWSADVDRFYNGQH